MDLALLFNNEWFIVEVKLIHDYDTADIVLEEGLEQVRWYRDRFDRVKATVLAIFDRREKSKALSWDEKIRHEKTDDDIAIFMQ